MVTAVPSVAAYSMSGTGDGGSGTSLRAVNRGALPEGGCLRGAAGPGGPLDAHDGQAHPGQVLQQPRGLRERPGARGAVIHRGQCRGQGRAIYLQLAVPRREADLQAAQ